MTPGARIRLLRRLAAIPIGIVGGLAFVLAVWYAATALVFVVSNIPGWVLFSAFLVWLGWAIYFVWQSERKSRK